MQYGTPARFCPCHILPHFVVYLIIFKEAVEVFDIQRTLHHDIFL